MGKKGLPRRVMSMTKRASKIAEEAADLDAVESVAGAPTHEKLGALQYIGAWIAGVGGVVVIVMALGFACQLTTEDAPDWSPEGALPHNAPTAEPFYQVGDSDDGRMGRSGSPFPEADTVDPHILEVECPEGTVHIAIGSEAADSLCVKGVLAGATPATEEGAEPTPTPTPTYYPAPRSLPSTGGR